MKKNISLTGKLLVVAGLIVLLAAVLEIVVRVVIELPVKTDFYSSIGRDMVVGYQSKTGVRINSGRDWVHLGWIAHPEKEDYTVYRIAEGAQTCIDKCRYGSCLIENLKPGKKYTFRVVSSSGTFDRTVTAITGTAKASPLMKPVITGPWRTLFRPEKTGSYLNDHTLFRGPDGKWHILGITSFGDGDYSKEVYFAHGVANRFPPLPGEGMRELEPVANNGHLAWAPHVIRHDRYIMWYSPHRCYVAESRDCYRWKERNDLSFLPAHPQFRDPMVFKVADGQWLMYCTARDGYYSTVDIYQSFDLHHWQYIRPALTMGFGAERAGAQASTESPFVMMYGGRFYLSFTYNNGSFFWYPLLLTMKVWPGRESYNETLVFHSANPYSFGKYRGRERPSSLVTVIRAHAPEYITVNGRWYITTAGWPWVATITRGECAFAGLDWKPVHQDAEK